MSDDIQERLAYVMSRTVPMERYKRTGRAKSGEYDPNATNYGDLEANAREIDLGVRSSRVERFELSAPTKLHWGDPCFTAAWEPHSAPWRAKASEHGVSVDREPKSLSVDVWPNGEPFTTWDDSVRGDGCLADGQKIDTAVGRVRNASNRRHLLGVLSESLRKRVTIDTLECNVDWNWTKGRPVTDHDDLTDIVHKVGERYEHVSVPWNRVRSYPHMPVAGTKKFKSGPSGPKLL